MNNGTNTISSDHHHHVSVNVDAIVFTLGILLLLLMCLWSSFRLHLHLVVFHVLSGEEQQPTGTAPVLEQSAEATNREQGLDESIIQSYPKILYSKMKNYDSVSSCCSICLVDFTEADELRMLPDCGHLHHVNCVDSWLKLHPTCPVCRGLPVRASESSVPAEEVTVHVE